MSTEYGNIVCRTPYSNCLVFIYASCWRRTVGTVFSIATDIKPVPCVEWARGVLFPQNAKSRVLIGPHLTLIHDLLFLPIPTMESRVS